jgi:phosphate uptake regulator
MNIRKIVKAGLASYTVSLPKEWIDKNKLTKGDSLYILEKSSNELLVSTEVKEKLKELREITIVTENKELGSIRREITAAYLNNYNTIIILGKDLDTKAMEIRRFLHDFVALEIEEQTAGKIIAKDLLDLKEISIEKTIRRIDMILRSMMQDSIKSIEDSALGDSIIYRDYDINRFYFLLMRLLKSAMQDPLTALSFKISNVQALQYWDLVAALEELGDSVKSLSPLFKILAEHEQKSVIELYTQIQQDYLDVLKAYYNKDKILADKVLLHREEIIAHGKNVFHNKVQNTEILNLLQEIISHINSIARLVIDY